MNKEIKIGGRLIGPGRPAYIVAEAGSNHNNDFDTARSLISSAASSGADAVKFQSFRARDHFSRYTPGVNYLLERGYSQSTYDLIRSLEIDRDWHAPLMRFAQECGITFLSSPCDTDAIDQLGGLGMAAFKVSSFELTDVRLIRRMAAYKRPMILSTGMADDAEIRSALEACRDEGNMDVILLQCTSLYPAPPMLSNLRAIEAMRRLYGCPAGYSDHTAGWHVAIAAAALGACMIEKHFTLDRAMPGPDHGFAIEPDEMKEMICRMREVEASLGDGVKNGPREEELEIYEKARRSLHARRAITAGEPLTRDNVCVKRPGCGIHPRLLDGVLGLAAKRDIPEDRWITWEDLR